MKKFNLIGIYSDQNIELERPDSDQEERKELEGKLQIILLESNRLKQELSVMKQANKTVRRENTDASIATNESIAMAKKLQKLVGIYYYFFSFIFSLVATDY